jgi:ubiquinone/menaquinone biosynthesis C-methylase UbiE
MANKDIKDFYNKNINNRYDDDYEFKRWFTTPRLRADYYMNHLAVKTSLVGEKFETCLEFGPGPGTWTTVLYKSNPKAQYELVDISEAMQQQFSIEMRNAENVRYNICDIVDFKSDKKFDLFFSSRALEYIEDKNVFFSKISTLMNEGARGIIITKNKEAFPWRKKDTRAQHQGQLSKREVREHMIKAGFKNIRIYPVIIRLPLLDRINTKLSEYLFKRFYKNELNSKLLLRLTESFLIKFEK